MGITMKDGTERYAGAVLVSERRSKYLGDGDSYNWHHIEVWTGECVRVISAEGLEEMKPVYQGTGWYCATMYAVDVDATPEVLAAHAAWVKAEAHRKAHAEADRNRHLARSLAQCAIDLINAGFHPAVKVVSTRTKVEYGTAGRAFFVNHTSYSGHTSTSVGIATSHTRTVASPTWVGSDGVTRPSRYATKPGRYEQVGWVGRGTTDVLGHESDTELCWASAAFEAGFDPEDALQVLATLDASVTANLPRLDLRIDDSGKLCANRVDLAPWVAAVKVAMVGMSPLDNPARVAEHAAQLEADKKAERKAKAAEKKVAKNAKA